MVVMIVMADMLKVDMVVVGVVEVDVDMGVVDMVTSRKLLVYAGKIASKNISKQFLRRKIFRHNFCVELWQIQHNIKNR